MEGLWRDFGGVLEEFFDILRAFSERSSKILEGFWRGLVGFWWGLEEFFDILGAFSERSSKIIRILEGFGEILEGFWNELQ